VIPSHCKVVGKLRLDGPLTEEAIREGLEGRRAYKLTDFYCATDGERWAVIRVRRGPGARLLVPIEGVELLAGPEETAHVEDPDVDTTNPTAMLEVADRFGDDIRAVVVQGEFNHMSFVLRDGSEVRVRVLDVVPPHPSKVAELARRALDCRPLPVLLEEETVHLEELARDIAPGGRLLFPCRASGLELDREVEYLDESPDIAESEDVALVGCNLSERIFRERYGRRPSLTRTMCPLELAGDSPSRGWTLVKCCKEKGPSGVHGRVVAIPWSATKGDTAAALERIVAMARKERGDA
jgi:hypothetical protein